MRVRRQLIRAAKALQEDEELPAGVLHPEIYSWRHSNPRIATNQTDQS